MAWLTVICVTLIGGCAVNKATETNKSTGTLTPTVTPSAKNIPSQTIDSAPTPNQSAAISGSTNTASTFQPVSATPSPSPQGISERSSAIIMAFDQDQKKATLDYVIFSFDTTQGWDNDYQVVNDNPKLRTYPVGDQATFFIGSEDDQSIRAETNWNAFLAFYNVNKEAYYDITVKNSQISRIAFIYVP